MDASTLYPLYCNYVQRLREALSRPGGPEVAEKFLPKQISLDEFVACWKRLAQVPGGQAEWATKLNRGFEADAADIRERLSQVLSIKAPKLDAA